MNILIAGATGAVGRELVTQAKAAGHRVTALARNAAALRGIADRVIPFDATAGIPELAGNDVVISALGAPIALGHKDRRPYRAVDFAANLNILKGARRAGVERFVYVSVHVEPGYAATAYVLAHEEFGNALQASGMANTIVRPTGIFTAFDELLPMARRGMLTVLGDGSARSNPIHPADVAKVCLHCISDGPAELNIGGPDVLTRREIAELAFAALGKKPRILRVPAAAMDFGAYVTRAINPRLGEMLEFVSRVVTVDCVAPQTGERTLAEYFRAATAPPDSAL
jgi:uncharacterized protein YbjT (DUF2867 family)